MEEKKAQDGILHAVNEAVSNVTDLVTQPQNPPGGGRPSDSSSEKKKRDTTPEDAAKNADVNEVADPEDP